MPIRRHRLNARRLYILAQRNVNAGQAQAYIKPLSA